MVLPSHQVHIAVLYLTIGLLKFLTWADVESLSVLSFREQSLQGWLRLRSLECALTQYQWYSDHFLDLVTHRETLLEPCNHKQRQTTKQQLREGRKHPPLQHLVWTQYLWCLPVSERWLIGLHWLFLPCLPRLLRQGGKHVCSLFACVPYRR